MATRCVSLACAGSPVDGRSAGCRRVHAVLVRCLFSVLKTDIGRPSQRAAPPTFGNSESFNGRPPSYRIISTDSDAKGSSDSPIHSSGSIRPSTGPAPRPTQRFIQDVWSRLVRRIPVMAEAEYTTGYAGLYTSTPDSHPIMDRVEGIDGLYICTGFSGHGFKLSPMVGVLMAELILEGSATTIDISTLRMSRFKEGKLNQPRYGFKVLV